MDNISIVIRCKNEEQWIGHSIQSVLDTFNKPEIIVIDNNSTDESMNIVRMFKKDKSLNNGGNYTDIKIYNMDNYSPGKSLNFGVNKCSNNYILILSAHSQIVKCNFDSIKGLLNTGASIDSHCVVWGKQIPIYKGKKITPRYVWSNFKNEDKVNYFCKGEDRYFLHNAFSFYTKDILVKYPFDEELIGKEDRYWINDRIKEGFTSFYDSKLICNHYYTDSGATWRGVG